MLATQVYQLKVSLDKLEGGGIESGVATTQISGMTYMGTFLPL